MNQAEITHEINQEINQEINEKTYIHKCEKCNFNTNIKLNWNIHLLSEKHNRDGQKKKSKCDKCTYIASHNGNLNIHILTHHSTINERKQCKLYCNLCDQVFFSNSNMEKHNSTKRHKNNIK